MRSNVTSIIPVGLLALSLLIRWLVGRFPHSGQSKPPMWGDYEAQRHWMEITTNLLASDWYKNTTDNDLLYWGLDYPPLTAYHMFGLGWISSKFINSSWTELHQSRGIETYEHKIYMRATVLIADLFIYMTAIIYYFYAVKPITATQQSPLPSTNHKSNITVYAAFLLLYPGQILIDHGHFQYNCVFMGLTLWAIILLSKGRQVSAAILYSLALNYKQMSLYYSLPFFWYIASSNLRVRPIWRGFFRIILVGATVLVTFALLFTPFLFDKATLIQVVRRLFPFSRGVFEDKVGNFWFALSVFYKYRNSYSLEDLLRLSTLATLAATLPTGLHLLWRPTIRAFRYALASTSLAFFLFSFQVHEKTILVPALPVLLLVREHPMAANWFVVISTYSLQPLLIKDGQTVPYFILMVIFVLLSIEFFPPVQETPGKPLSGTSAGVFTLKNVTVVLYLSSILGCFALSFLALLVKPPQRYPDIHPTINSLYCCAHFAGFLVFFYYHQFKLQEPRSVAPTSSLERSQMAKKQK